MGNMAGSEGDPKVSYSSSIPVRNLSARGIRADYLRLVTLFGVHVGLQHTTADELRSVAAPIEDLGFGWISVWDHFYGATGKPDDAACLEAVAMHAALACSTSKVRCGSLVYSIGYRHPAVLAKAITTIDQLSGGRAEMGIGAGWAKVEYDAYGIPFPSAKIRLDQLEEGIQCLRGLLHGEVTTFEGEYFNLAERATNHEPIQAAIPIWIGGGGEKRTLKIAARYADGWNVPFIAPEAVRTHGRCAQTIIARLVGRNPQAHQARDQCRPRVHGRELAAAVRKDQRFRATRCSYRKRRRNDGCPRPVRESGRRPSQHCATSAVRPQSARSIQRVAHLAWKRGRCEPCASWLRTRQPDR